MDSIEYTSREKDEFYMWRCIELARRGRNGVGTNPMVGSVIVCNDTVIGEGYHSRFGGPHAEVNAVNSVSEENKKYLPMSTLYVNLEPCAHFGKTPPCSSMIVRMGIKRVVIGIRDPFSEVDGRGIEELRGGGVDVTVGVLEKQCRHLNRRTAVYNNKHRPYIILKWAQTMDGYIDTGRDASQPAPWLTGERCRRLVHKWRSQERAIMAGTSTVHRDNPSLTVRSWYGPDPLRVTIDRQGALSVTNRIFDNNADTLLFTSPRNVTQIQSLLPEGSRTECLPVEFGGRVVEQILDTLYERKITSLIVEGGTALINSFIEARLYDELRIFVSPKVLSQLPYGHTGGVRAPEIPASLFQRTSIIDGVIVKTLLTGYYE